MSDAPLIENAVEEKPVLDGRDPRIQKKSKAEKKARKDGTGKPPKKPRVPSDKPKNTLAAWLQARGPNHHEAANSLGKKFRGDLNYARLLEGERAKTAARLVKAQAVVAAIQAEVDLNKDYDPSTTFKILDDYAQRITDAKKAAAGAS